MIPLTKSAEFKGKAAIYIERKKIEKQREAEEKKRKTARSSLASVPAFSGIFMIGEKRRDGEANDDGDDDGDGFRRDAIPLH